MSDTFSLTAATIDITPEHPSELAGYVDRTGPFTRIQDRLELNAVLLGHGATRILFVSADLLYVGPLLEPLLRRELDRAGLTECHILSAATHTHFAPSVDPDKPALGRCDADYLALYALKAWQLVQSLLSQTPVQAELREGTSLADHSINRRRMGLGLSRSGLPRRSMRMRPNPRGANDQTLHALRFDSLTGEPLAIVWSYACHPVSHPERSAVSADFPGSVRRALRARGPARLPVLFLQGFAGNLRPHSLQSLGLRPKRWLLRVLRGPSFDRFSAKQHDAWTQSLAQRVSELSYGDHLRACRTALSVETAHIPARSLIEQSASSHQLQAMRIALGDSLQLVAINAEPAIEYASIVRRLFGGTHVIAVGCVGAVFGYLPTARMLAEGGYEAEEFFPTFGLTGYFLPTTEAQVTDLFAQLARRRGV